MSYTNAISLDLNAQPNGQYIYSKEGDALSRYLSITLMRDGVKYTPTESVLFRAQKPDGHAVVNAGTIEDDGTITIELSAQTLAVAGRILCDVALVDGEDVVSTATFTIIANHMPNVADQTASSDEFGYIIEKLNDFKTAVETAVDEYVAEYSGGFATKADFDEFVSEQSETIAQISKTDSQQNKRIDSLYKLLQGQELDFDTQTQTAYELPVESAKGKVVGCALDMLGGMSRIFKNLVNPSINLIDYSGYSSAGVRYTYDSEKVITLNGTRISEGGNLGIYYGSTLGIGEYTISAWYNGTLANDVLVGFGTSLSVGAHAVTVTEGTKNQAFLIGGIVGNTYDNKQYRLMIERGSDVSSVYVPYSENGEIKSAQSSEIVSVNRNLYNPNLENIEQIFEGGKDYRIGNKQGNTAYGVAYKTINASGADTSSTLYVTGGNYRNVNVKTGERLVVKIGAKAYMNCVYVSTNLTADFVEWGVLDSLAIPHDCPVMHGINDSVYDYVDLEPKKFANYKTAKISDFTWSYISYDTTPFYFQADITDKAFGIANAFCGGFFVVTSGGTGNLFNNSMCGSQTRNRVYMVDTECANVSEFIAKHGDDVIHYEAISGGEDYEAILLHKRVGVTVFDGSSDESWIRAQYGGNWFFGHILNDAPSWNSQQSDVGLCNPFPIKYLTTTANMTNGNSTLLGYSSQHEGIFIRFDERTSVDDFRLYLATNNITVVNRLANEQILDVTDIFKTFDNLITVEDGGTLTFKNSAENEAEGIHIPVPSTETYAVRLGV